MKHNLSSTFLIFLLFPLAVGALSSIFSGNMTESFIKPSFSPPVFLFPIVWTVLYMFMGISSYIIYTSSSNSKMSALRSYLLQLAFNFFWSILFFRFALYGTAFFWLLAMIVLIAVMIVRFFKISPPAGYLQIPYLFWCIFAAVLNFYVFRLNI